MIKVSDVVLGLLQADNLALESLRAGLLNLSAYAEKIRPKVENLAFKEVKKGTIVVALSRLAKNLPPQLDLFPKITIENLSFKSSLSALSFDKTADLQRRISVLNPFHVSTSDLFAITEGPSEVTLICSKKSKEMILQHLGVKAKSETDDLVAATAQFKKGFAETPNVLHALLSSLAPKRINLVELISTASEISFVVRQADLEETVKALNAFFTGKA